MPVPTASLKNGIYIACSTRFNGEADTDTPPSHSRRVFDALAGPKRLILVPSAHHDESLRAEVWAQVDNWIDDILASAPDYDGQMTERDGGQRRTR